MMVDDMRKRHLMTSREIFNKRDEFEALSSEELMRLGRMKFSAVRYELYKIFKENQQLEVYPKIYNGYMFQEFEMNLGEKS